MIGNVEKNLFLFFWIIILGGCITFFVSCGWRTHDPADVADELYEVKDPDSNKPVAQIVATWNSDKIYYTPTIRFFDSNGCTWAITCYSNNPAMWTIYRIGPSDKARRVDYKKIYETSATSNWLKWSEFNEYKKYPEKQINLGGR